MGQIDCNKLRQLLESENPHIYIFDKQGQKLLGTLRVSFRFSRDKSGEPRIGFPIDVVIYDVNTLWTQRARQFNNVTILRLRTMYAHELLQFAEWLKRFVDMVTQYVLYCTDGQQSVQSSPPTVPQVPPQSQPATPTVPQVPQVKQAGTESEDLDELASL